MLKEPPFGTSPEFPQCKNGGGMGGDGDFIWEDTRTDLSRRSHEVAREGLRQIDGNGVPFGPRVAQQKQSWEMFEFFSRYEFDAKS
jgi:hypothetical protein